MPSLKRIIGKSVYSAAVVCTLMLSMALPSVAQAAWEPTGPVEIMVHSKPGSSPDAVARILQKIWADTGIVKVPVNVLNKSNQAVGFAYMMQHKGDPHKLTLSSTSTVSGKLLGATDIDFRDLTPISLLMSEYISLIVHPDSPYKTGKEFMAKLKEGPSSLSIAMGGSRGNPNHTAIALAGKAAGIDPKKLKLVFYSSGADARTAVIGKHIDAISVSTGPHLGQVQAGLLRVITVASEKRLGGPLAVVPTWKEQGLDVVSANWRYLGAAPGLTDEQIAYWEEVCARTVKTDEWKEWVKKINAEPTYLNRADTLEFFAREEKVLGELLAELGLVKK